MRSQGGREGQIYGNYRLLRFLGQGGFGEVYLAEHIFLQTKAAIKLLTPRSEQDLQDLIRAEAHTSATLIHPHIMPVLDFGFQDDIPYLVMPYAPHGTLRQLHPSGSTLTIERVALYVQQIAQALQFAHDHKIVHRDVKPENMLLGPGKQLLLSDFGIAVAAHRTESLSTQDVIGTTAYMAPEQAAGYAQPASDQYALAVCAYEWLAGRRPFSGRTTVEIALKHREEAVPSIGKKNPDARLSNFPAIEKVLKKALAKDPRKRFASITAFSQALKEATCEEGEIQGSTLCVYRGHFNYVCSLVWSPNGRWIASGGGDGTVQIWGAFTGQTICTYLGHTAPVHAITWSPNGKLLASGGEDNIVHIWNAEDGDCQYIYHGHTDYIGALAWSPDSQRIASASNDRTVQIWDPTTGILHLTYRGHKAIDDDSLEIDSLSWSLSGFYLASASEDRTVQVWDTATGKQRFCFETKRYVNNVGWFPNSTYLLCGNGDEVNIYNARTGAIFSKFGPPEGSFFYNNYLSLGGHYVASTEEQKTTIWDPSTGNTIFTYYGHATRVTTLAWSPDERLIASVADDEVFVWKAVVKPMQNQVDNDLFK